MLVTLTLSLWLSALAAENVVVERGAAEKLSNTSRAAERSAELKSAANAGDTQLLISKTRAILDSQSLTPAEQEKLLYDAALALRQVPPDAAAKALVDDLKQVPAGVLIWHGEGNHRVAMPRYEVAAAAASAQSAWQRRTARIEAASKLEAGPGRFDALLTASTTLSAQQLAGIEDAFHTASDADLALWRESLLSGLKDNRKLDGLAAIVASRLADGALFEAVFADASEAVALSSLEAVRMQMPSGEALRLLTLAARRNGLASASLLQMGALARVDASARERLFTALADREHGGSAAAALASLDEVSVVAQLSDLLENSESDTIRRRALLALRLRRDTAAADALARWRQTPARSAEGAALKAESAAWL